MELEQFVKETIVCILKGINGAKTSGMKAMAPYYSVEAKGGIEFDLGVKYWNEKIEVIFQDTPTTQSRIKFVIPITKE